MIPYVDDENGMFVKCRVEAIERGDTFDRIIDPNFFLGWSRTFSFSYSFVLS